MVNVDIAGTRRSLAVGAALAAMASWLVAAPGPAGADTKLAASDQAADPQLVGTTIGNVRLVKNWAYGTEPDAGRRDLYKRDPVVYQELVETVDDGALHLRFADDTEFRLGSASQAVLDRFVYNPDAGTGAFAASLGRGTFRFISGKVPKTNIRMRTPVATIGVRGTDLWAAISANGTSLIAVLSGISIVTPTGGASIDVAAGEAVIVRPDGSVEQVAQPSMEIGLSDDAGVEGGDAGGGGGGGGGDH